MSRRVVTVLVLMLVATACGSAADEERIAELETQVEDLREELADADATTQASPDDLTTSPAPVQSEPTAAPSATAVGEDASPTPDGGDQLDGADELAQPQGFETPSGNIACLAADYGRGAYLQCEIGSQLEPPPDDECDFDWSGVTMAATGPAEPLCASDTMRGELGPDPPVLAYGATWGAGPFTCTVVETGLTCTNGDGGRLFLSRAAWEAG